jgi:adenylate kinase family enzyme
MDGNYGGTLEERVVASDTVIVFAMPRVLCLARVLKRWIRYRGRTRPDLSEGCLEQLPDRQFIRWIWEFPRERLPGIMRLLANFGPEKRIVVLRSPRDVRRFLATVSSAAGSAQT